MPEILSTTDFDLPVTEEFLDRVQRGVRRRQAFRLSVAGCTVLVAIGGVFAMALPQKTSSPAPTAVAGPSPGALGDVERFRIGYLPDGTTLDSRSSSNTMIVTQDGAEITDGRAAGPLDATVAQSGRFLKKTDGGVYLWIIVLRPMQLPRGQGAAVLLNTLANRAAAGTTTAETFQVPAGTARLTRKVEGYGLVIVSNDLSVITIEANTGVPAEELKAIAAGLLPT